MAKLVPIAKRIVQEKLNLAFGEVTVERIGYRGSELNSVFPLDAQLNFSFNKYSHGLQDEVAHTSCG